LAGSIHDPDLSSQFRGSVADLVLLAHEGAVTSLCFSPDLSILASASPDGTIKLWSLKEGDLRIFLDHPGTDVTNLAISNDGRVMAAVWGKKVCVFGVYLRAGGSGLSVAQGSFPT